MTAKSIDFALRVQADLADAAKEVKALDSAVDGLGQSGKTAAVGLNDAATAAGKNNAAAQGNATAAKAAATAQTALGAATQKTAGIQQKGAISAAQQANAMRQLPAQITDIVTSLASGQSVFTVAIQQGGQLKDSFGGVGNASRALLGALSPTLLVVSAGAAAFGAIGLAMFEGYQETRAFERGLIATGYAAGVTAGDFSDMANTVGDATGKFGDADTAMLQLAQSGKFTEATLATAAQAAVNLAKLTGESIEETTAKILTMAESPTAAMIKLNDQYRFLTAEVYEHVRSLEQQGDTTGALTALIENFGQVHEQRVQEAEARAGALERVWLGFKATISGIWSDLKDLGRDDAEYRLQAARQALGDAQARAAARGFPFNPSRQLEVIKGLEAEVAAQKKATAAAGDRAKVDADGVKARAAIDKQLESVDKRAAKQRELNQLAQQYLAIATQSPTDARLTDGSREKLEAAIAAKYADKPAPKVRTPKAGKTDAQKDEEAAQRELENLAKQIAMLGELEEGERQVSREAQVRYEIQNGGFKGASEATKQLLIEQAKLLDATRETREAEEERRREFEKTEKAYEQLRKELRTPAEVVVEETIAQINALVDALNQGSLSAKEFDRDLDRAIEGSFSKAPRLNLPGELSFGLVADKAQLDDESKRLKDWYDEQLELLKEYREKKAEFADKWDKQEKETEAAHQAGMAALQQSQRDLQVASTQSIFDSMVSIARSAAGEQSKAYRVLFAISKGFAVAQLAVSLAQNVAKASEVGFPYNLPLIAGAFAQGAQIAAILSGANYSPQGYATGGRIVGPGTRTSDSVPIWASVDEHMIRASSATQPGARDFLDDFNVRGMPALWDWAGRRFADGGAITAMPEPRGQMGAAGASPVDLQNNMAIYMYTDLQQLQRDLLNSPELEKRIVLVSAENGQTINASWRGGG